MFRKIILVMSSMLICSFCQSVVFAFGPGISITSPIGYVSSWGYVFGSLAGMVDIPSGDNLDGALGVGAGLGDPYRSLGASVSVSVGSITNKNLKAFDSGYFNAAVGHVFSRTLTAVSVGANNIVGWHDQDQKLDPSYYGVITQVFRTRKPIFATIGVGNRMFSNKKISNINQVNGSDWGVFGALAITLLPRLNLIADYTYRATSVGISLLPLRHVPCAVGLSLYDIFEQVADNNDVKFYGTLSCAYRFA